jgi:uncharacterized glyoxalase superfamily protein PhnB
MIPARMTVVTLGAHDMPTMRAFYRSLGWREASGSDEHSMFDTGGGIVALFPSQDLADDANVAHSAPAEFPGFTLAINLESREAVDAAFETLRNLNVSITKEPAETFWGGYSGYFADPEGNLWEIVWGPTFRFDERGALILND